MFLLQPLGVNLGTCLYHLDPLPDSWSEHFEPSLWYQCLDSEYLQGLGQLLLVMAA